MSKGKILVVDDDRLVLATLTHGLSQAGYDVLDADNGDDAMRLARRERPQLALLDIRMEGKSGFDVAAYLREYCQMPFMFLSAFSDEDTVRQVKELGAVAYLVKPLDIRQIVPAVDAAFANLTGAAPLEPPSTVIERLSPAESMQPIQPVVAMAVGVLMQRHALTRSVALERLQRHAADAGRSSIAHAELLLQAVELLATSGHS